MKKISLTMIQGAALALAGQTEPMIRGIMVVPIDGDEAPQSMLGIDPGERYPTALPSVMTPVYRDVDVMLVVVNDDSIIAAGEDGRHALALMGDVSVVGLVLASGELLGDIRSGHSPQRLGQILSSIPAETAAPVSELRVWGATRRQAFAPVDPAPRVRDAVELQERFAHTVATGFAPDADFVAELAAAAVTELRDQLLLATARSAFPSLGEQSSDEEAMTLLVRPSERPELEVGIAGALALSYAAQHTAAGPEASQLDAMAGVLFWTAGRAKSAHRAAESALLHDSSNTLARIHLRNMEALGSPEWLLQ